VRRPEEYASGHVQGALHCELGSEMPIERLAAFDRAQPTAVVCERGYRSSAASRQLLAAGFTDLHNVHDGMNGWRANNLPLEQ
jgi:rhodanese-related sulfurtransferase